MAKAPYKYHNEETIKEANEYIDSCGLEQMELPTVEGLALLLDVHDDTLVDWGEKYPEFKNVMKKLMLKQKHLLINGGAFGGKEINIAMFIFLLKANHGMIETERRELVGKDGEDIKIKLDFPGGFNGSTVQYTPQVSAQTA